MIPRTEWQLATQRIGRRVLIYERVDSTNTLAANLGHDSDHDGLALLADEQTAGRGRQGHSWSCPPGSGVLLSVLSFPPASLNRPALLTAWAAVSVCETIRQVANLTARIKWPNDVLIEGKKVCGILLEQRAGARRPVVITGIGLNLTQPANYFVAAELPQAASLSMFTTVLPDRDQVARRLLHQLDEEYVRLCSGDLTSLEERWRQGVGLLNQEVVVECVTGSHRGRLRALTWDKVELEITAGKTSLIAPEAVLHLSAVDAGNLYRTQN